MRKSIKVEGTARYLTFEGGFWGIESNSGKKYMPINMPEQLKIDGARVSVDIVVLEDAISISMWGEVVRVVGFETISV